MVLYEIELESGLYQRANIKMEKSINETTNVS